MRKAVKFMAAGTILFGLLLAGFVARAFWEFRIFWESSPQPPTAALPALVRDLPSQSADIEAEFQRRVRAQYPDGMAATALRNDLRQKGFSLYEDQGSGMVIATLEQHDPICARTWIISWKPDLEDHARSIGAHFNLGCL